MDVDELSFKCSSFSEIDVSKMITDTEKALLENLSSDIFINKGVKKPLW